MTKHLAYFEHLKSMLSAERAHEQAFHETVLQQLSLNERKKKGWCWYPVSLVKNGFSLGEHPYLIVENLGAVEEHQLKTGSVVELICHDDKTGISVLAKAVINYVHQQKMKIVLYGNEIPEKINQVKFGVQYCYDERSYKEMELALQRVSKAQNNRTAELRDILLGYLPANFDTTTSIFDEESRLNLGQQLALNFVCSAQDVAVVHGPPGTGKTTTLVATAKQLARHKKASLLITAPSNAATDLLTLRLVEAGLNVVRVGNISRIDDELLHYTLEYKLSKHPEAKNIKKVKIQAAQCRREASSYKRHFGQAERRERTQLYEEARSLMDWANELEEKLLNDIISQADAICTTLVGAALPSLEDKKFDYLFVDEAAQALEPSVWIAARLAEKIVFFGDPLQLPPTIKSSEALSLGLGKTLMEKTLDCYPSYARLLFEQYRMNNTIMGFSNLYFYNSCLVAHDSVKNHRLSYPQNLSDIEFVDTAGTGFAEKINEETGSKYNPEEFLLLREHLLQLIGACRLSSETYNIGVISPYKAQVEYMQRYLNEDEVLVNQKIECNTIDAFQGQERDVIYISLVRSNDKGEIGFLKDYRRMNVALTRARKKLIVIGDSATLSQDPFYARFMDYCDAQNAYRTAWEFMS